MKELLWHHAPAACWRGTKTILQGKKRDERSYGIPASGGRQLGGMSGGMVLMRPSRHELREMMRHLETYRGTRIGAEQDFLTDFWKSKGGIVGLPRKCNRQMHQVALLGPQAPEDSVYRQMVSNHSEEVANWHFSADPKPVDMVWGSIAFPALEVASSSKGPVPANTNLIAAATRKTRPQADAQSRIV